MVLHQSPDGQSYGRYVPMGNGRFGFLPIIAALLPTVMQLANPPPMAAPPPPPSNLPLLLAVGLGGLAVVGGLIILVKA